MKVFVAGATGAIGRPLVRRLLEAGHQVTGMTRSSQGAAGLRRAGAQAVICDAFDGERLTAVMRDARPEAVVHQLTSLPSSLDPRRAAAQLEVHDRLRVQGTRNLVASAVSAGARAIVAQSVAFAYAPPAGNPAQAPLHRENDALYLDAFMPWRRSVRAVATLEQTVLQAGGTVLRYGWLYGPGTMIAPDGSLAGLVRRRMLPLVGRHPALWSFVHVDDAAGAVLAALGTVEPGVFNIVDDEPAPVDDWVATLAELLRARPPRRVPVLLARAGGRYAVFTMTELGGASNELARRRLAWCPAYPSWREGFESVFAQI